MSGPSPTSIANPLASPTGSGGGGERASRPAGRGRQLCTAATQNACVNGTLRNCWRCGLSCFRPRCIRVLFVATFVFAVAIIACFVLNLLLDAVVAIAQRNTPIPIATLALSAIMLVEGSAHVVSVGATIVSQVTFPEFFRHHWRWMRAPQETDNEAKRRRKHMREFLRPKPVATVGDDTGDDSGAAVAGGSLGGAGALPSPPASSGGVGTIAIQTGSADSGSGSGVRGGSVRNRPLANAKNLTVVLSAGATKLILAPPDDDRKQQANAEKDFATAIIAWVYTLLSMLCCFVAAGASASRHASGVTTLTYWMIGWFPYYLGMGFALVLCMAVMGVAAVRLVHWLLHLPCWQMAMRQHLRRICPAAFFSRRSMGGKGWAGGVDANRDGSLSPDDDEVLYTDATHNVDGGCCAATQLLTRYPILHDDEDRSQHATTEYLNPWASHLSRNVVPLVTYASYASLLAFVGLLGWGREMNGVDAFCIAVGVVIAPLTAGVLVYLRLSSHWRKVMSQRGRCSCCTEVIEYHTGQVPGHTYRGVLCPCDFISSVWQSRWDFDDSAAVRHLEDDKELAVRAARHAAGAEAGALPANVTVVVMPLSPTDKDLQAIAAANSAAATSASGGRPGSATGGRQVRGVASASIRPPAPGETPSMPGPTLLSSARAPGAGPIGGSLRGFGPGGRPPTIAVSGAPGFSTLRGVATHNAPTALAAEGGGTGGEGATAAGPADAPPLDIPTTEEAPPPPPATTAVSLIASSLSAVHGDPRAPRFVIMGEVATMPAALPPTPGLPGGGVVAVAARQVEVKPAGATASGDAATGAPSARPLPVSPPPPATIAALSGVANVRSDVPLQAWSATTTAPAASPASTAVTPASSTRSGPVVPSTRGFGGGGGGGGGGAGGTGGWAGWGSRLNCLQAATAPTPRLPSGPGRSERHSSSSSGHKSRRVSTGGSLQPARKLNMRSWVAIAFFAACLLAGSFAQLRMAPGVGVICVVLWVVLGVTWMYPNPQEGVFTMVWRGALLIITFIFAVWSAEFNSGASDASWTAFAGSPRALAGSSTPYPLCALRDINGLSIVEQCFMAAAAYRSPASLSATLATWFPAPPNATDPATGAPVLSTWQPVAVFTDRASARGPRYFVARNPAANRTIVAFRGTSGATANDDLSSADWLQNAELWKEAGILQGLSYFTPLTVLPSEVLRQAVTDIGALGDLVDFDSESSRRYAVAAQAIVQNITARFPGDTVSLVGHSLGGGLASITGARNKLQAVSFSGPGWLLVSGRFDVANATSLTQLETVVIPEYDPVPRVDQHNGNVQYISCTVDGFFACHNIIRTCCEMLRSCGDPRGRGFNNATARGCLSSA